MHTMVIADDEYIVVEGIKAIIAQQHMDYQVVGYAYNGIEAQKIIYEKRPNVVITDIRMPGIDGLSLIESCREFLPDTDFIIISGYTDFVYAKRALSLEVSDYIDKPVTIQKLKDAIEKIDRKKGRLVRNGVLCEAEDTVIEAAVQGDSVQLAVTFQNMMKTYSKRYTDCGELRQEVFKMLASVTAIINERVPSGKAIQFRYDEIENADAAGIETYALAVIHDACAVLLGEQKGCSHQIISQVLQIIAEKYNTDIGLEEIADTVKLNAAYLCMLFRQEVGISYVKYLTDFRMKKAKEMLRDDLPVAEVSSRAGYSNYRYFCYVFKKETGMTPNDYKGNIRKKQDAQT